MARQNIKINDINNDANGRREKQNKQREKSIGQYELENISTKK